MLRKRHLGLFISGIIEFLLIVAVVADLGGKPFREWISTNDIIRVRALAEEGQFLPAIYHLTGSLTLGGYTACLVGILCVLFLFRFWNSDVPPAPPIAPQPEPDPAAIPFQKLKIGSVQDLVGRGNELDWLKTHLIDQPSNCVAVVSVHGTGGMGKTFLAHVFAAQHREEQHFLEIYLGD